MKGLRQLLVDAVPILIAGVAALILIGMLARVATSAEPSRARKVRVALALSVAPTPAPARDCGKCRTDLDECRREASAGKIMVLFVGGCHGRSAELPRGSTVCCKTDRYDNDGEQPPTRQRIVVIGREGGEPKLRIRQTLPATASATTLRKAVESAAELARPKQMPSTPVPVAAPLDWFAARPVMPLFGPQCFGRA